MAVATASDRIRSQNLTVVPAPVDNLMRFGGLSNMFDLAESSHCSADFHRADAASGSPNSWAAHSYRYAVRDKVRYEVLNNSFLEGMARTARNDFIGTGPRLQIDDDRFSAEAKREIEQSFAAWAKEQRLASKFRDQWTAKRHDGEGIGVIHPISPDLSDSYKHPVKLGYRLIDADRLTDETFGHVDPNPDRVDGLQLNRYGDPVEYNFLKTHPDDDSYLGDSKKINVKARFVFHWFNKSRPEQRRGISELASACVLANDLRGFVRATVKQARFAACLGGFLKTDLPPILVENDRGELCEQTLTPGSTFRMSPDDVTCLPRGYDFASLKAPSPVANHSAFVQQAMAEIGRASCLPRNKSTGDSSGYNYSSGRLDHQDWWKCIKIDRYDLECDMDRLFSIWWDVAILTEGFLSQEIRRQISSGENASTPVIKWHWDGFEHVDPQKEAAAATERLRNGTGHLAEEWAKRGKDWNRERKIAAEAMFPVLFETDPVGAEMKFMQCIRSYLYAKPSTSPVLEPEQDEETETDQDSENAGNFATFAA